METFPALLAICVGNSPVTGEFHAQRPVTRSFDGFYDLRPSKQWWGWWFEMPSHPLWRHCHAVSNMAIIIAESFWPVFPWSWLRWFLSHHWFISFACVDCEICFGNEELNFSVLLEWFVIGYWSRGPLCDGFSFIDRFRAGVNYHLRFLLLYFIRRQLIEWPITFVVIAESFYDPGGSNFYHSTFYVSNRIIS